MTQYRTYIDSNTAFGQQTIQSVTNNGSQYGIGIGTNITAGVVTATTYYGDGSQLSGIMLS